MRNRYENTLRQITVEMRAELGRTRLPISELMKLQEGDVIPLERRTNEPIRIFVGAKEKFLAKAGKAGKYRALRVLEVSETHLVQEEDQAHEVDELH